ncbi:MAG: hypothetical protein L0Y76_10805 [Ignavibacteria bacterium]|nr:hypothetical protein [Ignavibacteria bacterium]
MKAYFYILIALIIFTVFMLFYGNGFAQTDVIVCDNYDSLYNVIKSGKTAEYNKTAWISGFSLVEYSSVKVAPSGNNDNTYKVIIKIDEIVKGEYSASYDEYSVLGYIVKGCGEFGLKYRKFNNTSCRFNTPDLEDVMEAVKYGISFRIDNQYELDGSLVSIYKNLCIKGHEPIQVKKPAVYLYPVTPMNVSVNVEVNGKLTYTDPDYGSGWNVRAEPGGLINSKYDYLFYEADLKKIELPDVGWVVEYDYLEKWFDEYLPALGLNEKETGQFKEYWLGKLRKADYYEIRILDDTFLAENMRLIINPEPETVLRLNFYFTPLSEKREIKPPLIKKTERTGFTVIEWGGIDAGDSAIVP